MTALFLIKHATPEIAPDVISHRWVLSELGQRQCEWLADQLELEGIQTLYSSTEPKALETAARVAVRLGLAVSPREGLQENNRTGVPFDEIQILHARIQAYFARPDDVVMGAESAQAAGDRFACAIEMLVSEGKGAPVAVVTHGTVLTTFVARHNDVDPFALWKQLTTPSAVIIDSHNYALLRPPLLIPQG